MIEVCRQDLKDRIDALDPEDYRDEDILEIVRDIRSKTVEYVEMTKGRRGEQKEKVKELVEIDPLRKLSGLGSHSRYRALFDHGFGAFDAVEEVHIKPAFRMEHGRVGLRDIERGFGRVADRIVDHDRSAKAVIGCSWLMDTPIAKRLGFIQVPEAEMPMNDFSTWLQFVNEDGQIHQERLHHMLETGELPFRSRLAYMPTENFLEKYLSEERKQEGPIELDEVDEQASAEFSELSKAVARANEDWDWEVSQNGSIDLDDYLQRHPAVSELLNNYYFDEDRSAMERFMREMATRGVKRSEFPKYLTRQVERAGAMSNRRIYQKLHRQKTLDFRKNGTSEEVA